MFTIFEDIFVNDIQAGAMVQWLKLPAWKVGDRWFKPHSGLKVLKKQECFYPAHS